MSLPQYENGIPPVVGLREYDTAAWAKQTCIDRKNGSYVIVDIHAPEKIIATLPKSDYPVIDEIFRSAHLEYAKQIFNKDVQKKEFK